MPLPFLHVRPLLLPHLLTATLPSFQFFGLSFGLSLFFHLFAAFAIASTD